jgi:hypothetical protein
MAIDLKMLAAGVIANVTIFRFHRSFTQAIRTIAGFEPLVDRQLVLKNASQHYKNLIERAGRQAPRPIAARCDRMSLV